MNGPIYAAIGALHLAACTLVLVVAVNVAMGAAGSTFHPVAQGAARITRWLCP